MSDSDATIRAMRVWRPDCVVTRGEPAVWRSDSDVCGGHNGVWRSDPRDTRGDTAVRNSETSAGFHGFAQLFGLEVRVQWLDDDIEIAVHHVRQVVHREADTVVGHAILRKVVRADLLGAVTAADHPLTRGRELRLALLPLDVVETRL